MFRKLCDREGTPTVSLDRDELRMDGIIEGDGTIPDDQEMYINRLEEGIYLVRAVDDGDVPDLPDINLNRC